jgi:hypothetical protein
VADNPHFALPFRFGGTVPAATNLIPNGGFEKDLTGWFAAGDLPGINITRSTAWSKYGSASLRFQCSAGAGSYGGPETGGASRPPVIAGQWFTFSFFIRPTLVIPNLTSRMVFFDSGGNAVPVGAYNYYNHGPAAAGVERWCTHPALVPAGASNVDLLIYGTDPPIDFSIDGLQLEKGSKATPYIDTNGTVATRSGNAGAFVNEQDSLDDIADCVVAILNTHLGWRDEVPEFGIPDLTFRRVPIGSADLFDMIGPQEPRAIMVIAERPGERDTLSDKISIGLSLHGKGHV